MVDRIMSLEHRRKIGEARLKLGLGKTERKVCPRCKRNLNRSTDFGVRDNGFTDSYCKECFQPAASERQRKYLKAHPEVWEKVKKTNREVQMRRKYGISVNEYERLFMFQGGVCAICKSPPKRGRKTLDVDHCHKTNVVRGLLCSSCNRAVGLLRDDIESLKRAVTYLTPFHKTPLFPTKLNLLITCG